MNTIIIHKNVRMNEGWYWSVFLILYEIFVESLKTFAEVKWLNSKGYFVQNLIASCMGNHEHSAIECDFNHKYTIINIIYMMCGSTFYKEWYIFLHEYYSTCSYMLSL